MDVRLRPLGPPHIQNRPGWHSSHLHLGQYPAGRAVRLGRHGDDVGLRAGYPPPGIPIDTPDARGSDRYRQFDTRPRRHHPPVRIRRPLPRDRHGPGRHAHRTGHPRRCPRLAIPNYLLGHPLPDSEGGVDCPLRFPSQYADEETGLNYNYFRYCDPETARYTTPDPLGLVPAPNAVAYVRNPHSWADHLGLAGEPEWANPEDLNFSQRTVSPNDYVEKMRSGEWDWQRP
ncbi:RHS repeat-associated core domain-containing protein [Streptomyces sp. NBC_00161]|uniref:RHS repeat-associated core domain-containing protein n=1 Tax=Streptomyces sp. NBC_00161 TaxID=2975671 RepID=UPI00386A65CE